MADQLEPGDVVVLKSGGPSMTVRWVEGTECACDWFDDKNKRVDGKFVVSQLKLADDQLLDMP